VADAGQHHRAVFLDAASSRAMRLKPMLTSRISLVSVFSSSRESRSPSRMRLAANDSSFSGRLISRARRRADQRGQQRDADPHEPGAAGQRRRVRLGLQPVTVALDREADPQAGLPLTLRATMASGPRLRAQLGADAAGEAVDLEGLPAVAGLARGHAHHLLRAHGLQDRHPVDAVGLAQRGARQVHQAGRSAARR
jgi:hypothetical protein